MHDATRERFGKTAERVAALQDARAVELEAKVLRFVSPTGDERVLDSGSGPGALAFALAPHVREVVALDLVPELLEEGRSRAGDFPNVSFVEGDATKLPFELGIFDANTGGVFDYGGAGVKTCLRIYPDPHTDGQHPGDQQRGRAAAVRPPVAGAEAEGVAAQYPEPARRHQLGGEQCHPGRGDLRAGLGEGEHPDADHDERERHVASPADELPAELRGEDQADDRDRDDE